MKISIITVVYNNKDTIKDAIESVLNQDYKDIEYIIVDGASNDGTVEIINSYTKRIDKFISESDKGIYDAMNKGLKLATGDVVGILNSDDFYIDNCVLSQVLEKFKTEDIDALFANLIFVRASNLEKIVRHYDSSHFTPDKFAYGWMPAHPTFFVKREAYIKYGLFKTDYKIAADYELLVRFLYNYRLKYYYLNKNIIKMRLGGASTSGIKSNWILNREIIRACAENGIKTNMLKVLTKYPKKLLGLLNKIGK